MGNIKCSRHRGMTAGSQLVPHFHIMNSENVGLQQEHAMVVMQQQ
jgi:hypothetical protein